MLGKTEVQIRAQRNADNPDCDACAYYTEFRKSDGTKFREPYEGNYKDLAEVKGAPQPKKTEFVSLLKAQDTNAAIAFDADTDANCDSCSSWSFSHTVTGTNAGLLLTILVEDATDGNRVITAASYAAVGMRYFLGKDDVTNNAAVNFAYLSAPSTGANTVSITATEVWTSGNANASSYTGVNQVQMVGSTHGDSVLNATSVSYPILTDIDNAWTVDAAVIELGSLIGCTPTSGQTEIFDAEMGALLGGAAWGCVGYEGPHSPVGSQTTAWSCNGVNCDTARDWTSAGVTIIPFCDPAVSTCTNDQVVVCEPTGE